MNLVCISGNLTKDPEHTLVKGKEKDIDCCRFTVAVKSKFKDESGEYRTDFLGVVVWRGLAKNCVTYLSKGSKVAVTGYLQTRTYEVNDTKRYATDIVAENVEFLTPKTEQKEKEEKEEKFVPIDDTDSDTLPF